MKVLDLPISEIDLSNNISKVEHFTQEESECIEIMIVEVDCEVVDKHSLAFSLSVVINNWGVKLHYQHLDFASLPHLPQVSGDVEHDGLGKMGITTLHLDISWMNLKVKLFVDESK